MPSQTVTKGDFDKLRDTLDRWRVTIQVRQDEHHKFLFGNGEPGMDETLREVRKFMQEADEKEKARDKERRDAQLYYMRLTVGTALSSLIIMLINGVVYFAKILPVLEKLTP